MPPTKTQAMDSAISRFCGPASTMLPPASRVSGAMIAAAEDSTRVNSPRTKKKAPARAMAAAISGQTGQPPRAMP